MNENVRFYICPICGNIVGLIEGDMSRIVCCGKPMEQMTANTTDAAVEKHVPVYEKVEDELQYPVNLQELNYQYNVEYSNYIHF